VARHTAKSHKIRKVEILVIQIKNVKKIRDIDLSIIGRICIRFEDNTQTYVSRRYIPKIKKHLGI